MTIQHTLTEILQATYPGLEIEVVYSCESEITTDDEDNEQDNYLLNISAAVNGALHTLPKFPMACDGNDARRFLARVRESARNAVYATEQAAPEYRTHAEMFPQFRPISPGSDEFFAG